MKKFLGGFIFGSLISMAAPTMATLNDFKSGFEAGVRYGLLAYMENPKEASIPTITKRAAQIFLFIQKESLNE